MNLLSSKASHIVSLAFTKQHDIYIYKKEKTSERTTCGLSCVHLFQQHVSFCLFRQPVRGENPPSSCFNAAPSPLERQTQEEEMAYFFLLTPAIHYLPDGGGRGKDENETACTDDLFSSLLHLVPNAPVDSLGCSTHRHQANVHAHTQRRTRTRPYRHIRL